VIENETRGRERERKRQRENRARKKKCKYTNVVIRIFLEKRFRFPENSTIFWQFVSF